MAVIDQLTCFKSYDVRGRVPHELNPDIAYRIGRAICEYIHPKKTIVGKDIRPSGVELSNALKNGLLDGGSDVVDIGLCGTEMVYFATSHLDAQCGIMVTASHNPPEYNGMKIVREGSRPISADNSLKDIEKIASQNNFTETLQQGREQSVDVISDYAKKVLSCIDFDSMKSFKVAVNSGNGCAGPIVDHLEPHLPFELLKIHHEPDGSFPNGVPNPLLPENRLSTSEAVLANQAHIGVAWDGDFDRCFLFDETGRFIEGYYIVGFLANSMLERKPNAKIIYDPRLTWNTIEMVKESGGIPVLCPSGHTFIKGKMRENQAIYGGEMSAHHYFRDFYYCDSGMLPWLLVLEIMSKTGKKLSELVEERMAMYPCSGEINRLVDDPDKVIEAFKHHYDTSWITIDTTDGVSMEFNTWRFNLRKSNTEPKMRLNVETKQDVELLQKKTDELLQLIESFSTA